MRIAGSVMARPARLARSVDKKPAEYSVNKLYG
jgi:hypothetical protein